MILPLPLEAAAKGCAVRRDPASTAAALAKLLADEEIVVPGYHERHQAYTDDLAKAVIEAAVREALGQ